MKRHRFTDILWVVLVLAASAACIFLPRPFVPAFSGDMHGFVLVIDAGHGGEDGGALTASGVRESDLNLSVAKRACDVARFAGLPVHMIRTDDVSVYSVGCTGIAEKKSSDLRNRVKTVNAFPSAILLSIHQNHFSDPKYSGAQTFYAASAGSKPLAELLQNSFRESLDSGNKRQAKRSSGVYLMEHVQCPAVLVECGFLSNPHEAELLQNADYQKKLALAMICPIAGVGKAVTANEV